MISELIHASVSAFYSEYLKMKFPSYLVAQRYLAHSSSEHVYEFLSSAERFHPEHEDESYDRVISSLLEKGDQVIDLAIAGYSSSSDALNHLFRRNDPALFHSIAANPHCFKRRRSRRIKWPTASDLQTIITSEDKDLVPIFFKNPTFDWSYLDDLICREQPYDKVSDSHWHRALYFGLRNPLIGQRSGDEMEDFCAGGSCHTLSGVWKLLTTLPNHGENASILGEPICNIQECYPSTPDHERYFLDMLEKWTFQEGNGPNAYMWLRQGLACHATRLVPALHTYLIEHTNDHVRAGYYQGKNEWKPSELASALKKDGNLFLDAASQNPRLHRRDESSAFLRWSLGSDEEPMWEMIARRLHQQNPDNHPSPEDDSWAKEIRESLFENMQEFSH